MGSFSLWHWIIMAGIGYIIYRLIHPKTKISSATPEKSPNVKNINKEQTIDELYEHVADELRNKSIKPGLWAKAFSESDGDKGKAQAIYIRYRVAELQSTHVPHTLSSPPAQPNTNANLYGPKYEIWNPNAAANWSLIFTPAFGSYLQMLNWRILGEPERAASSQNWFYVSLGLLAIYVLMGVFMSDSKAADGAARGLGFLFLLIWYFSAGRAQSKYVKEKLGASYARKPWGKALLIGVAAIIGYFIAAVVVGLVLGVAG